MVHISPCDTVESSTYLQRQYHIHAQVQTASQFDTTPVPFIILTRNLPASKCNMILLFLFLDNTRPE